MNTDRTPNPAGEAESPAYVPTIVTVVIDRSGSMESLRGPVVEGVNELVAGLEAPDRVTIVQFDSHEPYSVLVDAVPAAEVTPIPFEQYQPRGGTPLFDAVGIAIARTAGQVREAEILTGSAPNAVLAIVTDGFENASKEYSADQVRRLIERSREEGWTITYVGIGMGDAAFTEARRMGVHHGDTTSWGRDRQGTGLAFRAVSEKVADSKRERRERERRDMERWEQERRRRGER